MPFRGFGGYRSPMGDYGGGGHRVGRFGMAYIGDLSDIGVDQLGGGADIQPDDPSAYGATDTYDVPTDPGNESQGIDTSQTVGQLAGPDYGPTYSGGSGSGSGLSGALGAIARTTRGVLDNYGNVQVGGPNVGVGPVGVGAMPGSGNPGAGIPGVGAMARGGASMSYARHGYQPKAPHLATRRVTSWMVRGSRRMNPLNVKALRRGMSRMKAFEHIAKKMVHFTRPAKHASVKFRFPRRKKRS